MSIKKIRNKECFCGSGKKLKDCHLYTKWNDKHSINIVYKPRTILIPEQDKYLIIAKNSDKSWKLFQFRIWKDWTLFIDFWFFNDPNGLLTELLLDPNFQSQRIDFSKNAKAVSHLVKYTHHIDWNAHFSQDWKILTKVRKKAVPIKDLAWHVFTIMLQGFQWFNEMNESDYNSKKQWKYTIDFTEMNDTLEWVKFVGRWFHRSSLWYNSDWTPQISEPIAYIKVWDELIWWYYLSSSSWPNHILHLSYELVPWVDLSHKPCLTFMGWFDPIEIIDSPNVWSSVLFLSYPRSLDLNWVLENIDFKQIQ